MDAEQEPAPNTPCSLTRCDSGGVPGFRLGITRLVCAYLCYVLMVNQFKKHHNVILFSVKLEGYLASGAVSRVKSVPGEVTERLMVPLSKSGLVL